MFLILRFLLEVFAISWVLKRCTRTSLPVSTSKPYADLDAKIVMEAMNREKRAKAALVAVLHAQGCTTVQISSVLKDINGGEEE